MTEGDLLRDIRAALNLAKDSRGRYRCRVVRNSVGFDEGRKIHYGLAVGSADLVGILRGGSVFAVEVKLPGERPTLEQRIWIRAVRMWGGFAGVAHSVDEALALLAAAERARPDGI